ncbi:MAG TPA: hypothetical protein VNH83_08185 [Bryobacteraceae bacterium]|nr:hypothetical protein [Bryobacteraceae bacterium]
MSSNSWNQALFTQHVPGPTLTAAAAASLLVAASPVAGQNRFTIPANTFKEGDSITVRAFGIVSCAVTTPGTFRIDLRFGSTVVFDTGAIPLNIVAQTNVPWWLDVDLSIQTIGAGTTATLYGQGILITPATINVAAQSTGPGPGGNILPYNSVPAISSGFDSTIANVFDSFFTQTVATGSFTCRSFRATLNT